MKQMRVNPQYCMTIK